MDHRQRLTPDGKIMAYMGEKGEAEHDVTIHGRWSTSCLTERRAKQGCVTDLALRTRSSDVMWSNKIQKRRTV